MGNKIGSEGNIIQRAIIFAQEKHKGQLRKDGSPYITHPLRVADIVKKFKKSHKIDELIAAAILHDTLEDTNTCISELKENFGKLVALLVINLTSDKSKIICLGKANYLSQKMSSSKKVSNWALVIKLADRLDNVSDLNNHKNEFAKKYKIETEEILQNIEKNRELSNTHKEIIKEIRKKLDEVKI
jgi:(p)ppGpp synthase/HD superfamily hydrolase